MLQACAGTQVAPETALTIATLEARASALETENRNQAAQLTLLRGQLALAQADARDAHLRDPAREIVRIGGTVPPVAEPGWIEHESPVAVASTPASEEEPPTPPRSNASDDDAERPVLRLHNTGTMPLTGSSAIRESLPPGPSEPPSVSSVVGVTPTSALPFPPAQQAPVVLGRAAPADSQAAREAYRVALSHVTGRRFEEALPALSAFIDRYPSHPYVDNALFWRATASYALRHYTQALSDFQRVVAEFPSGNKVPDALLQIGMCYLRLGDMTRARAYFERLRHEYPQSVAARLAAREDTT